MASRGVDSKLMTGDMWWTQCDMFVELHGYGTKSIFRFDWMTMRNKTL